MKDNKTRFLAQAGVIAALYIALTFIFAPISFGEVQLRVAEALTILPLFTPAAVPGLFIGCFLGNLLGGAVLPDVVFGSLATLIGAFFTGKLNFVRPWIATLPPVLANTLIVPFVLRYAYGVELPIPFMMMTVSTGELLSCTGLGLVLYYALKSRRRAVFGSGAQE